MKNLFLFLIIVGSLTIISTPLVFGAASLTISPTSGPVGTTITAKGNGFTPGGSTNSEHNFQASASTGFNSDGIFLEKFTGLPVGGQTSVLTIRSTDNGTGNFTVNTGSTDNHSTGFTGNVYVNKFDLASGGNVTHLIIHTFSSTGHIRYKVYDANGTGGGPGTLMYESGSLLVSGNEDHVLSTPVKVGHSKHIWAGFELLNDGSQADVYFRNGGVGSFSTDFVSHVYGTGPSPFGTITATADHPFFSVVYEIKKTYFRAKVYQDDGAGGGPHTLLGQSGPSRITGNTGVLTNNNASVIAIIPASGNIWAGFETSINYTAYGPTLKYTNNGVDKSNTTSHNYGPGPNPISTQNSFDNPYMNLYYSPTPVTVSFSFDGTALTTSPSTVTTNSTGGFSGVTFQALPSLVGGHNVEALDSSSVSDTKTFTTSLYSITNSITGFTLGSISDITPFMTLTAPPSSVTATQEQLFRNGTLVLTNAVNKNIPSGGSNAVDIGENMPGPSSYFVNVTTTDGANFVSTVSNTITLIPSNFNPNYSKPCGVFTCASKSVNYTAHRTPDFSKLLMTVNVLPIPFNLECKISNGTFNQVSAWHNFTAISAANFSTNVIKDQNAYFSCYGSGLLFSGISLGNSTAIVQGANVFNQTFGVTLGVPIGTFFLAMLASLANQRTGPIYVVLVLAATGIMSAVLFFTIPNGAWALELIIGFLGLFVGRKIF